MKRTNLKPLELHRIDESAVAPLRVGLAPEYVAPECDDKESPAIITDKHGNQVVRVEERYDYGCYQCTARRLVASYNSLAGISTAALESGVIEDLIENVQVARNWMPRLRELLTNPADIEAAHGAIVNIQETLAKLDPKETTT